MMRTAHPTQFLTTSSVLLMALLISCSPKTEQSVQNAASKEARPQAPPGPSRKYTGSLVTDKAPWLWRDGARLHYFRGKYWLLGGWTNGPRKEWDGDDTTNEIWSSPDLATWTLARKHVSKPATEGPDAHWTRRHCFGSVVFHDYLWVIGRDHIWSAPIIDVWRSKDALTWECVMPEGPMGRKRMPLVTTYAGAIHVLGGETEEPGKMGYATASHWRSTDGAKWEQLPDMPFVRSSGGAVEWGGRLLVLGGNSGTRGESGGPIRNNDVWAWDGKKWERQTEHAPWPPMMWMDVVVYDGKVWVLAGRHSDIPVGGDSSGAWYSSDAGKTWTHVQAPWPPTHADGVEATEKDGIVMAGGNQIASSTYRLKVEESK